MKKLAVLLAVLGIVTFGAAGTYQNKTATIAAGDTSVSVTNTTSSVWLIEDVYCLGSTAATSADTVTVYKVVSAGDVRIDEGTLATTAAQVNIGGKLIVPKNTAIKIARTANSTNAVITVVVAIDSQTK